jgi:hypothetical protein
VSTGRTRKFAVPPSNSEQTAFATTVRVEIVFLILGGIITTLVRIWQKVEWPATICEATAWAAVILAVSVASDMRQRFELMLERLFQRGAIDLPQDSEAKLKQQIQTAADRSAIVCGLLLPAILLTAYVRLVQTAEPLMLVTSFLEVFAALIVGRYLGRGIVYGFLGTFLKRRGAAVLVKPSHPDGAAGLKPAGEFYIFQAALLMIPAAFLGLWWLAMKIWIVEASLKNWQDWYLVFFFLAIACELAAFVFPLLYFHQEMKARKRTLLMAADDIGDRIVAAKEQLLAEPATSRVRVLEDELAGLSSHFESIEDLPTWPFDQSLRRRLTFGNVTLVVPILVGNLNKVREGLQNLIAN